MQQALVRVLTLLITFLSTEAYASMGNVQEASGAWTYSVPIKVPPFRGVEPRLGLNYNSSGGNGIYGVGWSLAGFSEIALSIPESLIGETVYYLDGQKLISCAQNNTRLLSPSCIANGTHTTEIESFLKISFDKLKKVWKVWRTDGTQLTYGSQHINIAGALVSWGLSEMKDTSGNVAFYSWTCLPTDGAGRCYPQQVLYNTEHPTSVRFNYQQRPDPVTYPNGGSVGVIMRRLSTIAVLVESKTVRAYEFSYQASNSTGRSLLTKVTEFGTGAVLGINGIFGESLPPTTFVYEQPTAKGWQLLPNTGLPLERQFVLDKDVLGYSRDDGLRVVQFNGTGEQQLIAAGNGKISLDPHVLLPLDFKIDTRWDPVMPAFFGKKGFKANRSLFADINGDGLTDFMANYDDPKIWLNTGSYNFESAATPMAPSPSSVRLCTFVDLTGDGRPEFVCSYGWSLDVKPGPDTSVAINLKNGWRKVDNLTPFPTLHPEWGVTFADLNGDGLQDILRCGRGINTDPDFTNEAFINTGLAFVPAKYFAVPVCFRYRDTNAPDAGIRVIDLNGDGRSDLLQSFHGKNNADKWITARRAWINNGHGWTEDNAWAAGLPLFIDQNLKSRDAGVRFMDVNADGNIDLLQGYANFIQNFKGVWLNSRGRADLMVAANNGIGGKVTIDYTPSTSWPYSQMPFIVPTVEATSVDDGRSHLSTTTYAYSGALFDGVERRFLGFRYVKKTLPCSEVSCPTLETYFSQDYGSTTQPTSYFYRDPLGSAGFIKLISYEKNGSEKPYRALRTAETTWNTVGGESQVTTVRQTYDFYGNMVVEVDEGDTSLRGDEITTRVDYLPNANAFITRLPSAVYQYTGTSFSGKLLNKTFYYYDGVDVSGEPQQGLLTKKLRWLDVHDTFVTTQMQYDTAGQLQRVTDENGNVKEFVRNDNLFVTETRDALFATDPRHKTTTNGMFYAVRHARRRI
jgi:YD repeat-containing protein